MGWNEKEGIGKTNKQNVKISDIEVRPRGLGLGVAFNKKKDKQIDEENIEDRLSYVKGAFLEILVGKHANKYAQLVSFDDGLGKIIVKLVDDNETLSVLQVCTRLVSKSEVYKSKK